MRCIWTNALHSFFSSSSAIWSPWYIWMQLKWKFIVCVFGFYWRFFYTHHSHNIIFYGAGFILSLSSCLCLCVCLCELDDRVNDSFFLPKSRIYRQKLLLQLSHTNTSSCIARTINVRCRTSSSSSLWAYYSDTILLILNDQRALFALVILLNTCANSKMWKNLNVSFFVSLFDSSGRSFLFQCMWTNDLDEFGDRFKFNCTDIFLLCAQGHRCHSCNSLIPSARKIHEHATPHTTSVDPITIAQKNK